MSELHSQTSDAMTNSAPCVRQAWLGRTHEKPPSFSCSPSRDTGRRSIRTAQLALIAEDNGPLFIMTGRPEGTAVATAVNGSSSCSNRAGKCLSENLVRVLPCNKRGQNIERAISAIACQLIPAASAAPMMLPTLVPAMIVGLMPTSCRALITPMWASPRTAPPLRARPTRLY